MQEQVSQDEETITGREQDWTIDNTNPQRFERPELAVLLALCFIILSFGVGIGLQLMAIMS